jgi:hypothetical protein
MGRGDKMKKIIFMIILFFCFNVYSSDNNGILKVSSSFVSTGVEFEKINVEGRGKIFSKEKLNDIAVNIFKSSRLKEDYKFFTENDSIDLWGDDLNIRITKLPGEYLYNAYFLLSQHLYNGNINNIRRSIIEGFRIYNVKPTLSYLIVGKYPYKMTVPVMRDNANRILINAGAKFVNEISDRNLVSIIGFLPAIKESIKINEIFTNVNIALRYNDLDKSTYIWIGCPIISIEY